MPPYPEDLGVKHDKVTLMEVIMTTLVFNVSMKRWVNFGPT